MSDILGLNDIFRAKCAKPDCHFDAAPRSMYCGRHQSRQEIEDRHGPIIEERAKEGAVSKVLAEADKSDDITIAESYQERVRTEEIEGRTAEADAAEAEVAVKKAQESYASDYARTKVELENALRVPLMVHRRQVFRINGVPWILEEGMNSVPVQIKNAYEEHQQMLAQDNLLHRTLRIAEDAMDSLNPKSKAYYEDVLLRGYRGEETEAHRKRSRL